MKAIVEVLELSQRHAREAGPALPEALLDRLLQETGAQGGGLGRGGELFARVGAAGAERRRHELPGGRESFWLEVAGGTEPDAHLRLAAGLVLSTWVVREELKKARFSERRRLWEVESLRAIGEALGGTLDPARIAEELLLHATAMLDARRGEVWLAEAGGWAPLAKISGVAGVAPCPDGGCFVAARVGGSVLAAEEVASLPGEGLVEAARLAVPVTGRRGRLGVLALAEREVRGGLTPFDTTDRETLSLYASQAAIALENATLHQEGLERERLERELELAAAVQRQLLPSSFSVPPGYEVAAKSEPTRHVGGDLYDLLTRPGGFILMLADVAGKGVPAALMAASLHAAVRLLSRDCKTLGQLVQELHAHLLGSTLENKFATMFIACLREGGELEFVSAGHNPVVLASPGGAIQLLHASGPPLGLLPDVRYSSERAAMLPGALLLAYTDGLSEAPDAVMEEDFGVERIVELTLRHLHSPLERLVSELFAAVASHTGGAPPHDDRTVVLLRRLP